MKTLLAGSSSSFRDPIENKTLDLPSLFLQLAPTGVSALEAVGAHFANLSESYLDQLRSQSQLTHIAIRSLDIRNDLAWPDASERSRQLGDLCSWMDVARTLDVPLLHLRTGALHPDVSSSQARQWVHDALESLLDPARERTRRLALDDGSGIFDPLDLDRLLRSLDPADDHPTLGLSVELSALDTQPVDRVFHVRAPLEDGAEPFRSLVDRLRRLGPLSQTTPVVLEYHGKRDPAQVLAEIVGSLG